MSEEEGDATLADSEGDEVMEEAEGVQGCQFGAAVQ